MREVLWLFTAGSASKLTMPRPLNLFRTCSNTARWVSGLGFRVSDPKWCYLFRSPDVADPES